MDSANVFLYGALATTGLVAALFFLRFFRLTGDRLFVFFALAFATLSAHWTVLALAEPGVETRHYHYVARLAAFGLILVGVLDKNRRGRGA
jgi:hypothetical protein